MSYYKNLLKREVKKLWLEGATEEDLMKLFKIKREMVKENLRS